MCLSTTKKIIDYQETKHAFHLRILDIFTIFMSMNEHVTDISQVLKRLTSEMASMREGMDALAITRWRRLSSGMRLMPILS